MEREAMMLALEALEHISKFGCNHVRGVCTCEYREAADAIKTVLAQPAQEPGAWAVQGCSKMWRGEFAEIDAKAEAKRIGGTCVAYALYISPPQREWVGLTDEEIDALWQEWKDAVCLDHKTWAKAIEAKLKEKNNGT
jgi:hypothetical protein